MAVSPKLAKQTQQAAGIPNGMRLATVTALGSAGYSVNVNGAVLTGLACLDSTVLRAGDTVTVFKQDQTWLILGRASKTRGQWTVATLENGFTQSFYALAFRLTGDNNLQVSGRISSGATTASGTGITFMPAGYYNPSQGPIHQAYNVSSGANLQAQLTSSGEIILTGTWANGDNILLNAFYPLDHP